MPLRTASLVSDVVQIHQLGKRPNHSLQQLSVPERRFPAIHSENRGGSRVLIWVRRPSPG